MGSMDIDFLFSPETFSFPNTSPEAQSLAHSALSSEHHVINPIPGLLSSTLPLEVGQVGDGRTTDSDRVLSMLGRPMTRTVNNVGHLHEAVLEQYTKSSRP
jgi:hypothetical protein